MTIADKIAKLPELPLRSDFGGAQENLFRQLHYWPLKDRLSLLLETVRAYTEAVDTVNNMPYERDNGQARIAALNSRDEASLDLRTLQAHLEGERT